MHHEGEAEEVDVILLYFIFGVVFVGWLLELYLLATSRIISGWALTVTVCVWGGAVTL